MSDDPYHGKASFDGSQSWRDSLNYAAVDISNCPLDAG
jgi:hypothetical protein